jgi:hypothetical protein
VERTFFKRPKAGNQRLVVPVRDDFVIDFNLFALDEVHKAQAASGGNICLKKDCGCQSLALVRGFTEALAGTDDHRRAQLEQRVMRALIEDNQTSKGSGGSGSTPSKQASSEARSSEADSGDEGDGGGGGDMLSMLMGAAVSDSDSDSDSEGGASKPPPAVARAMAASSSSSGGGGSARAPPPAPAASRGPSRPPAPRHDNVDLKAHLKAGAVARLGALAKKLSKQSEEWDLAGLPPDCVCPITSEAFVEPVVCVGDGYTYEKSALTVWFLELSTSPVTGAELSTKDTVPNHAVKGIVDAFAAGTGVPLPAGGSNSSGSGRSSGGSAPPSVPRPRPAAPAPRARPVPKSNDLDSIYMSRKPSGAAAEIKSGAPAVRRPMVVEKDDSNSEDEMSEEMFQVVHYLFPWVLRAFRYAFIPLFSTFVIYCSHGFEVLPSSSSSRVSQAMRNGGGGGGSARPVPSRPKPSTKAPEEGGDGEGEKKKKSWSVFGKKK